MIAFFSVSVFDNLSDINNPKFGMSLDKNADGFAEEIISPNSIINADEV